MSKTTFLGYVPSLKSKHEATIVGGKAIESKGGSIRYTLQGEYQGRKTLPKTVSKADFESVYGFDAKEAEAVIITGTKGGFRANKLFRVGKTKSDGFTPKLIEPIDKEAVEKIEKMADTVGSPSPASVEPPAPSEKPFPQEPSNENFSAEYTEDDICFVCSNPDTENEVTYCESDADCSKAICDDCRYREMQGGKWVILDEDPEDDNSAMADVCRECADNNEPVLFEAFGVFGKKDEEEESEEPKTQEFTVVLQEGDKLELTDIPDETEAQEDGGNDEMEEKEEETAEIEEKEEEKEAEGMFLVKDIEWETDGEDVDLPTQVWIPNEYYGDEGEPADWLSDNYGFLVVGGYADADTLDDKLFEAVQAKVTRPVKEDETEDEEESEEGLSTLAKVGLGVGALAVGAAIFGAEGEYPEEFLDEVYDFDSHPNADTYDEETIALAYAAWLESKKNEDDYIPYESETDYSRIYEASGSGEIDHDRIDTYEETEVHFRHDNPMTTYDWTTSKDDLTEDEEDMVDSEVRWDIGSEPSEGDDSDSIDVDGVGTVDYTKDTDYGDKRFYGLAAEDIEDSAYDDYLDELEGDALVLYKDNPSQLFEKAYPIDYEVGMSDYESSLLADIQSGYTENSQMFDEDENLTPYGEKVLKEMYDSLIDEALGIEWLASKHPPSELLKRGDPMAYRVGLSEYQDAFESESDGYAYAYTKGHEDGMGDEVIYRPRIATDKGRNIYKKILRQKAETFGAESHRVFYSVVNTDTGDEIDYGQMVVEAPSMKEALEKAQIMLDENAYEGEEYEVYPNGMRVQAESFEAEDFSHVKNYDDYRNEFNRIKKEFGDDGEFMRFKIDQLHEYCSRKGMMADTVGSPSPSGPSSTPEPAEATGSEPSNENMEAEGSNMKMALGVLGVGVGMVALLGGDRIKKILDKLGL